jgi:hypothetical protein
LVTASHDASLALPESILHIRDRFPESTIAVKAKQSICQASACEDDCSNTNFASYGVNSGFFYAPAAQLWEWGIRSEYLLGELLELSSMIHFVYRVEDAVYDAAKVDVTGTLRAGATRYIALGKYAAMMSRAGHVPTFDTWSTAYREYAKSIRTELQHRTDPSRKYESEEILRLGNRAAPLAVVVDLMCALGNRTDSTKPITGAVLRLCTALQLVDDLQDLPDDIADGNLTWPAKVVLNAYPAAQGWEPNRVHAAADHLGVRKASLEIGAAQARTAAQDLSLAGAECLADLSSAWSSHIEDIHSR